MPSPTSSILRSLLCLRKAAIDWNVPVATLRARQAWADRLIRAPGDVDITAVHAAGGAAEWLSPPDCASSRVILYLHGGGWTLGLNNLERRMLARVCRAANVRALAVHYRLAPEQPFPAALEDCVAVYRWLVRRGTPPQHINIIGFSAGGNLALATLMALRDAGDGLPVAAVCISCGFRKL